MDINALIGKNLKRLREGRGLSQADLAKKIDTTPQRLSSYEVGRDGMGKEYMERVCRVFDVAPWEFFIDDNTPIVKDERERGYLEFLRKAEVAGVAERVLDYGAYEMQRGRKGNRPVPIAFNAKEREALRLYERAEEAGVAHLLDAFANELLAKAGRKKGRKAAGKAKAGSRRIG